YQGFDHSVATRAQLVHRDRGGPVDPCRGDKRPVEEGIDMTFVKVKVSRWCTNPQESVRCMKILTTDRSEIDAAVDVIDWESGQLDPGDADEFIEELARSGGEATRE